MELFKENYDIKDINAMPVLALAHIGDGVYELLARSRALKLGNAKVGSLHKRTVAMVSAEAQAKIALCVMDSLNPDEKAVLLRGRNTHAHHAPPHKMNPDTYPLATGLEALFGYLYLSGKTERIAELWEKAEEIFDEGEN